MQGPFLVNDLRFFHSLFYIKKDHHNCDGHLMYQLLQSAF